MENFNELLPIGSIVLMKNGKKKLAIIGVKPFDVTNNKVYDYLAVPYPEGFIQDNLTFFILHEKIEKVISRGYEDEEREQFIKEITEQFSNEK